MKDKKTNNSKKKALLHSGHRERLRKKFSQNEKGVLEPHEILELLLYYSIPRRNTNEIAHELLNKFGGIKEILEADVSSLESIPYVKKSSVALFKAMFEMNKRNAEREKMSFSDGYNKCTQNIKKLASQTETEGLYVVYAGRDGKLLFSIKANIKEKEPIVSVLSHKSLVELEIGGVVVFKFVGESELFPTSVELDYAGVIKNSLNRRGFILYEYYLVSKKEILGLFGAKKYNAILFHGE